MKVWLLFRTHDNQPNDEFNGAFASLDQVLKQVITWSPNGELKVKQTGGSTFSIVDDRNVNYVASQVTVRSEI